MSNITTYYESNPSFINQVATLFDGTNESVDHGDVADLKGINKMTISIWFKPIPIVTAGDILIAKWDFQTQGGFAYGLSTTSINQLQLFIADSLTDNGSNRLTTTDANITMNIYQNLVVVYNGTLSAANRLKAYKNAILLNGNILGTIPTSLTNGTASLKIAKFGGSVARNFKGVIDEPPIYLEAFNQDEVTENFNGGKPLNPLAHSQAAKIAHAYRMGDNDIFPTIKDGVGAADGTMLNMEAEDFVNDPAIVI